MKGEQGVLIATSSLASLVEIIWVNDEEWCNVNGTSSIEIVVTMGLS
jgi:hypothetical protein